MDCRARIDRVTVIVDADNEVVEVDEEGNRCLQVSLWTIHGPGWVTLEAKPLLSLACCLL